MAINGFDYGYIEFNAPFLPAGSFPLDARSLFSSFEAANVAAKSAVAPGETGSNYYHGQIVSVLSADGITHYTIESNGTLTPVGAQTAGDNKTIVLNNGVLSLANFGQRYYKYIAKDVIMEGEYSYPDNMPSTATNGTYLKVADVWYVMAAEGWTVAEHEPNVSEHYELTEGWPANKGLTAQAVLNAEGTAYELAWYEPSTVTVEGLSQSMAAMQTNIDAIDAKVGTASETSNANKAAIEKLNADANTEGSVDYKIAQFVSAYLEQDEGDPNNKMDSLKDLINWAEQHDTEVASYGTNIETNKQAIADLEALVGELPEGIVATDVIGYIQELYANCLTDASQFATAEQGAKADTAVQKVVAGEVNGHISVDGVDVKVYELNPATITDLGGIKPDGSSIKVAEDGTASVGNVDYTKITGLSTQLENTKNEAVEAAGQAADEKYVAKENIVTEGTAAENVDAASDGKVISEKLFMTAMSWKTEM